MDEFRKAYEYNEETGVSGVLLFLFLMLISVEPFLAIIGASSGHLWTGAGIPDTIFTGAAVIYGLFSLFAGIVLKKKVSFAVSVVKSFLIFRVFYLIPFISVTISRQISEIPFLKSSPEYMMMKGSLIRSFIIDIAYVLIFSVGWYIYLLKSRRVKELFNGK